MHLSQAADTDKVDFGNGLVIDAQSLGVANKTSGFDGTFDGILGVGPVELTEGNIYLRQWNTMLTEFL